MITSLTNGPGGGGGCSSSCVPNGTEGIQSQRTHSYFKKKNARSSHCSEVRLSFAAGLISLPKKQSACTPFKFAINQFNPPPVVNRNPHIPQLDEMTIQKHTQSLVANCDDLSPPLYCLSAVNEQKKEGERRMHLFHMRKSQRSFVCRTFA